jgi:single-stranded-DNA-specific exonuclease
VTTTDAEFLDQPTLAVDTKLQLPLFVETRPPLWIQPTVEPKVSQKIATEFHLHPVLAEILVNRKIFTPDAIHSYLYARLPDLLDPFLFAEMPQAVERITKAIKNEETILVYGDNDVDGMTGTALLTEFLTFVGAKVLFHISNRTALLRQSMILDALEFALRHHCTLLITVDCGITAAEHIEEVVRHHVDVIITDHHEPTKKIPHCIATLNPKLVNCVYPNRDLTGVGVAFKLAHALTEHLLQEEGMPGKRVDLKRYLDLVAIGTVADMGALTGENRILVSYGLEQLQKTKRIGLAKLLSICEIDVHDATTSIIASKIAPRLNSLGRIAEPENGVKILLVRNALAAEKLAIELNLYNIERQKIERMMTKDVERVLQEHPNLTEHRAIVLSSRKWHPGIIAILAMRLSKHFNRPCVIIASDGQIGKGSVRSIPEFPVLPALKELSDLLLNFGGHDAAAGLTIREQHIEEFTARFIQIASEKLQETHVTPKLYLDAEVPFDQLTFDLMDSLKLLEPYGQGNPPPILFTEVIQVQEPKIVGRQHLKLFLEHNDRMLEGIASGQSYRLPSMKGWRGLVKVAYTPQVSGSSIHLIVRDFQKIGETEHAPKVSQE